MGDEVPNTANTAVVCLIRDETVVKFRCVHLCVCLCASVYLFILYSIQASFGRTQGPRLRTPVERPISSSVQGVPRQERACADQEPGFAARRSQIQLLLLPLVGCATLSKFLNHSGPECPHLGLIAVTPNEYVVTQMTIADM